MSEKTSLPKGTRDFSPEEMIRRNVIFDTITGVFKRYGYQPIETPAMENLSTLLGKYGEEGDKLLFKILNSGDFLTGTDDHWLEQRDSNKLALKISEKGLRYDLTVPFARYVVMHRNELTFPFKRYQIQPVWRADKPQKGRYREFYQCDVDVIGSNSLLNEAELIQIIDEVFFQLGLAATIRINNRKILSGLAETIGQSAAFTVMTTALDKIDKIGMDHAMRELADRGIDLTSIDKLRPVLEFKGENREKLDFLEHFLAQSQTGIQGVRETKEILFFTEACEHHAAIRIDLTLARGLNYYTGTIIEVTADDMAMGSLCGGGRYDDLTGIFGLDDVSGVGVSFGADRIYDVMLGLKLFPDNEVAGTQVLLVNFGQAEAAHCMKMAGQLRKTGINTEVYPENEKLKKQLGYADKKSIPYVLLMGENEIQSGVITVKEMKSGEQFSLTLEELIRKIR